MSTDAIAKAARTLIDLMPTDVPWERQRFVDTVASVRERPIRLIPVTSELLGGVTCAGTTCGLWLARDTDDLLVYGSDTSAYNTDQVICHEIGHMMLAHETSPHADFHIEQLASLTPSLANSTILRVLGRSDYDEQAERDAEAFADLVMIEAMTVRQRRVSAMRSTFFRGQ
jgi:hypothetical protein